MFRYGDIHSFSMFGHTAVVINSIAGIKDLKLSSSDMFNNRPVWLKTMCKSLDPGIAFNSVDEYLVNREFLLNNLKKRGMGKSGLEPQISTSYGATWIWMPVCGHCMLAHPPSHLPAAPFSSFFLFDSILRIL